MIHTVTQDIVAANLPGSVTRLVEGHGQLFQEFANGTCNVIAGDTVNIVEQRVRETGYTGEYKFADKLLSHEHLALLTRQDDPEWADFCNWVLKALVTAEAQNITQATAHNFATTGLFGPEYEHLFINAIAAVGNYGELYERHYGTTLPRSELNQINRIDRNDNNTSGLLVSDPLGTLLVDHLPMEDLPKPIAGGTLETVSSRGYLTCGVISHDSNNNTRYGFAEQNLTSELWHGMDVDYCRALAAAVSAGRQIRTEFVDLSDHETRFWHLANHSVDVLAGDIVRLATDVREPTTQQGFTFATPYFYEPATTIGKGYARALVTRQDDPQWSDLAQWITQATIYAEENDISQSNASKMPVVGLFGDKYKQMFRDAINATGNYGEIYHRNVQRYIPRGGRNLLNTQDGPQFYPIPFD
jgi:hypothetical protein